MAALQQSIRLKLRRGGWIIACILFLINYSATAQAQQVEPFEISVDFWHLIGDLHLPEGKAKGVVILLNKAAGSRQAYTSLADKLSERGIAALRLDLRGHGDSINLDTFDYKIRKNHHILEGTCRDIAAVQLYLKGDPRFFDVPQGIIGASYSGEHMVLASDDAGFADAYIALSPGSFSDESMTKIDPSGVPWLFVRAEVELPFFPDLFDAIDAASETAEIRVIPGEGHGTDILLDRPELEDDLADWMAAALAAVKG